VESDNGGSGSLPGGGRAEPTANVPNRPSSPGHSARLLADAASVWRYVHARTIARILPRLRRPIPDRSEACQLFLRRVAEARSRFSILQVGAYDGVSNDPVHDLIRSLPHVRAVLLEPQAVPHAALQRLWQHDPRVAPLKVALAAECGERPLYVIAASQAHLHPFAGQVASFSRAHVERAFRRYVWRPSPDAVTPVPVATTDWRTLTARYGPFDLVVIDAEGFDGEIISMIDLTAGPPDLIVYEHCHLPRHERLRCSSRLRAAGYIVRQVTKNDTLAARLAAPEF
jgi:FkbM family methyltransferase